MASAYREIHANVAADAAWRAISDVARTHVLFPGVLVDCRIEGDSRIVTFANGMVVRELIVDVDTAQRRLAYAAVGGRLAHHHATLQVFEAGSEACRIEWTVDFLPADFAPMVGALMEQGAAALPCGLHALGSIDR